MAGDEEGGSFGRPPYVGMSRKLNAVEMDTIYRHRCDVENDYLKDRSHNPPQVTVPHGQMAGFDVEQRRSYLEVRNHPASSAASSFSRASRASGGGGAASRPAASTFSRASSCSRLPQGSTSGGSRASRASRDSAAGRPATPTSAAANLVLGAAGSAPAPSAAGSRRSRRSRARAQGGGEVGGEIDWDTWTLPKYTLTRYSMHHMTEMERAPDMHRSATNLRQSLSAPLDPLRKGDARSHV